MGWFKSLRLGLKKFVGCSFWKSAKSSVFVIWIQVAAIYCIQLQRVFFRDVLYITVNIENIESDLSRPVNKQLANVANRTKTIKSTPIRCVGIKMISSRLKQRLQFRNTIWCSQSLLPETSGPIVALQRGHHFNVPYKTVEILWCSFSYSV